MNLNTTIGPIAFSLSEEEEQKSSRCVLNSWSGFHSDNSREGLAGSSVLLVLEPEDYETPPNERFSSHYESALDWLFANEYDLRNAALTAIFAYVRELREEYGVEDEELDSVDSPEQLKSIIDLSYVRVYPHRNGEAPYLGLEFECNWDPDNGCGVLFHGLEPISVGGSESAQSPDIIEEHGGEV